MIQRYLAALAACILLAMPVYAEDPPANDPGSPAATESVPPAPPFAQTSLLPDPIHCDRCAGHAQRWWFSADYEFAWIKGMTLPPLVTTSPAGTAQANAGVLGQSSTTVLFGNKQTNSGVRPGTSLDAGYWLTEDHSLSIQAGYRIIGGESNPFRATSDGNFILGRPFTNASTGAATAVLIGFPGLSSGTVAVQPSSHSFQGVHIDMTEQFNCSKYLRLESIFGYRFFRYDEDLDVFQSMNPTSGAFVPGTLITANDHFGTKNEFHGGEFGLRTTFTMDRWSVQLLTQVDVGQMYNKVEIAGGTQVAVPGNTTVNSVGGLLALPSNIGTFHTPRWVALPEMGFNFGYQVTDNVKLKLGYSWLELNNVVRPGDQIDLTVNPTLFPGNGPATGPNRPGILLRRSDIWVQSLNLGVEVSF